MAYLIVNGQIVLKLQCKPKKFYPHKPISWLMSQIHICIRFNKRHDECIHLVYRVVAWTSIVPSQKEEWIPIRQGGKIIQGLWEGYTIPPGVFLHSVDFRWWYDSLEVSATGYHHLFLPSCWVGHSATTMIYPIINGISLSLPLVILFDVSVGFPVERWCCSSTTEEVPIFQSDKAWWMDRLW